MTAQEKKTWLDELLQQRIALKRQLFAVDSHSVSLSAGGGSKSLTNRSIADLKEKIAAIENEIAALCGELGEEIPFKTTRGVYTIKARF